MNQSYLRGVYLRLAGALMLVVILALAASAYLSHLTFERALAPEMSKKIATVGASVRSLVLKAVDIGIRFDELYGVEQKFDEVKEDNPEVSYMAITDTKGRVLHQRLKAPQGAEAYFRSAAVLDTLKSPDALQPTTRVGDQYLVSLPLVTAQGALGVLHIGVSVSFVDNIILDMLFDVLVVLVVSLFFAIELLHFMAGQRLESSLRALGETIERGAQGDFATPRVDATPTEFSAVHGLLEATLARINAAFAALWRDVEAGRHGPAHERPPGLGAAQAGLLELANRFRFGKDETMVPSDSQLSKVRAPLFIFILAEELTRSFLPSYVNGLLVDVPGLSPAIVVGLPIALFMFIVAIGQPYLGAYSERVGHRHTMRLGAIVAAVGFVATAFSFSVLDLLLWRSLCAVGYAMVFVAGQGYVLDHSVGNNRARSFALFIGAIMVATVCGPSIGGILADNIGARPTFVVAALLALLSMLAMTGLSERDEASCANRQVTKVPSLREVGTLLASPRFMTVTALAAIPAKMVLTGMLFYLVPMYMLSIGANQAMTGRILMVYAVMMVIMGPLTATLATTRERMEWLVGGGLILSGIGGLLLLAGSGVGWVFAATVLVGLGQSLSMAAQSALVSERCPEDVARLGEQTVYGVYRLLERLGNAVGPVVAGALVLTAGYRNSFVVIGGAAMLCGLVFMTTARRAYRPALVSA
jgi:MFS family permease